MTARFRLFFDMDGVLVDFARFMRQHNLTSDEVKKMPGAYLCMPSIAGALEGIRKVMSIAGQYGGEVWLATKPPTGIPIAYADKVAWVLRHLPELKRRIIITHDKGLLGGEGDYLVDDRPWRANCEAFRGTLIGFGHAKELESTIKRENYGIVRSWFELPSVLHDLFRGRDEHSLDDINAARDLLRLGPLPGVFGSPLVQAALAAAPIEARANTLDGFNTARGFIQTRPAHGGYPGEVREGEHAIAELARQRAAPAPLKLVRESTPSAGILDCGAAGSRPLDGSDKVTWAP